jgi:hypothetical protein
MDESSLGGLKDLLGGLNKRQRRRKLKVRRGVDRC